MKNYYCLLFVLIMVNSNPLQAKPKLRYCVTNTIAPHYINSFTRQHDTFVQQMILAKTNEAWKNISNYSSNDETLKILQNKDAVPLLVKKYDMLNESHPDSASSEPFIFLGEMPAKKFQQFKIDVKKNYNEALKPPKYCFMSSVPLKNDSYEGVSVFLAQDYEVILKY